MSLFEKNLSELIPGSHIRLTNRSGQSIEGIILENDGKESLSIQISSVATIRYDQIGMIDDYSKQTGIIQEIVPVRTEVPSTMEIKSVSADKSSIAQAYKAMEKDEKNAFDQAYNKFQNYLSSHEESKYNEAIQLIQKIINDNKWSYNPRANLLLANILLFHQEYSGASKAFFYALSFQDAYRTACQGSDKEPALYSLAAVFSAAYLLSDQPDDLSEASEAMKRSSAAAKDVSGIEYVLANSKSEEVKARVSEILRALSRNFVNDDTVQYDNNSLLTILKQHYTLNNIGNKIKEFFSKLPVKKDTEQPVKDIPTNIKDDNTEQPARDIPTNIDDNTEQTGKIIKYNFFEARGIVKSENGIEYPFEINDIKDISLQNQVKKISSKKFDPINVKFSLSKLGKDYVVSNMRRGNQNSSTPPTPPTQPTQPTDNDMISFANQMFSQKNYIGAMKIYKQQMDGEEWETAFFQTVMCYLALCNENEDQGYLEELRVFVEKYADRTAKNKKTLEAWQQYYYKIQDYEKNIHVLNDLIEACPSNEYGRILQYITNKERCYKLMKNFRSAISELLDWLSIVNRNKLKDRYTQRDTLIYIELAELYYEVEDYENAEKYVKLCDESERKHFLQQKLDSLREEIDSCEISDTNEEILPDEEESLQMAYEAYTDTAGFDALDMNDTDIITNAFSFNSDRLYCLLTYLNCAASLSESSDSTRTDENGETIHIGSVIKAVNTAVSYAFNSPLADSEYQSTEIISVFQEVKKHIPGTFQSMFASCALYTLFSTPSVPDYNIEDLLIVIDDYHLESYPDLIPLINDLLSFREKTGYGMDSFAGYKTKSMDLDTIIEEAKSCCESIDMRNDVYESQGQVRRLREYIFSNSKSELRTCLNIVAANDIDQLSFVNKTVTELFMRPDKPADISNLDNKKLDKYIDKFWDIARNVIYDEGRHINRPYDKIKAGKRSNVVNTIKRTLSCICNWISVAKNSTGSDNAFALKIYDETAPKVINELNGIINSCANVISENGFDWGTESLRIAAEELLSKMKGTYNNKSRRYFFIDFLKGEDVLLNDSYLPETQSTFCGVPGFNILSRIKRHASKENLPLHERFTEILSNIESKHNFRTARLIKEYGEDMDIKELTEHKNLPHYNDCLKQARLRFETKNTDFFAELELCESYGTISNLNGEKDRIWDIANSWYRISKITGDYGFHVRLLEMLRNDISVKAQKKGEKLMRQLEDLSSNPNYNFGVFSKEMIEAKINDQNFSSAEYIMGCILRGDVNVISDYSNEPFGYFNEFINEYATNSRAVRGAGRDIADTIFEYSGKKDLEKALLILTNNAHKETKGGANLLKSWIPRGGQFENRKDNNETERKHQVGLQVEKLLNMLGFKPESVQLDQSLEDDAYNVLCRKQIGKVNYVHHIPAFGSKSETEGFRVLCLYGTFNCDALMDKFRSVNSTAKHTLVLLDFAMNLEERRRLARKIKEEKTFAKTFIVLDRVILFYLAKHYASNTVLRRLFAVTLPFAYYQPFVESSTQDMPQELFTGREAELTSIESPDGANLVYGGRQLGKSALLKMAKNNVDRNSNGDRAVWIDIKKKTAADSLKVVCDKLIIEGIIDESCVCETWSDLASQINKRLISSDPAKRINFFLLMLDEADTFIATSEATDDQPITAFKNLPSDRFKLVMAGLHEVIRYNRRSKHGNSSLIHLKPLTIRQFRRDEATKLLTSILAYLGFRFNQKIIDNILASTYNYPGLIQFYCQKLLEAMKNDDYAGYGESSTPYYEVTESHYKKVLSDKAFTDLVDQKFEATLFVEEEGHSNYHIIALIIAYLYYTEPNEKGYTASDLLKTAHEYSITRVTSLKPEQFSEILNEMCDLNVITVMDGYYRFATDGFRKYLGNQEQIEKSISDYFEEVITE